MVGRHWGLSSGLGLLLLTGCHSYPYSGQYYGGTSPYAMPSAPMQSYPSGGSYMAPNNGIYVPQGTGGASPTPLSPTSPGPAFNGGGGTNPQPTFRPDVNSGYPAASPGGADRPVPKPDLDFGADPSATPRSPGSDGFQTPFSPSSSLPPGTRPVAARPLPGNPDLMPMPPVSQVGGQEPDPRHFGYDPAKYTWLQGTLEFDDIDKTWNIMYNLAPGRDDPYGGSLVLVPDSRLTLPNESLVKLEGFVDQQVKDRFGKPMYRIQKITPLQR